MLRFSKLRVVAILCFVWAGCSQAAFDLNLTLKKENSVDVIAQARMSDELSENYNPNVTPPDDLAYQYMQEGKYTEQIQEVPLYREPSAWNYMAAPAWGIDKALVHGDIKPVLDTAASSIEAAQKGWTKSLNFLGLGEAGQQEADNQNDRLASFPNQLRETAKIFQEAVDYTPPNYNSAQKLLMGFGYLAGYVIQITSIIYFICWCLGRRYRVYMKNYSPKKREAKQ